MSEMLVAMLLPGMLRLGGLRIPVYGVFAAAGLIAALWLSQQTAGRVGLDPDRLWDAGMFGIVAAFVASRVLLVVMDLPSFIRYPLLVMALPSWTYGGMLLTGLLVWGYLRFKRVSVPVAVDAWAPCGCLLAAVLSVGHFVEGTDAGMPTSLPWGVVTPGDSMLGRVHPVQLYGLVAWLVLGGLLLRLLGRRGPGHVAALAMALGGVLSFVLDMLRQPVDVVGGTWLDPGQFVALAAMIVGGVLMVRLPSASAVPVG